VCSGNKVCTCPAGKKDCGGFCGECCQDSECPAGQACQQGTCSCASASELCFDGKDNDCDGLVDCDDPECDGALAGYTFGGYNPDAWWLDGLFVNGVCVMLAVYCSQTGPKGIAPPPGYIQDSSTPLECGFNGCGVGSSHSCQANFCKDCSGNCEKNCP
jgi:hypothetical protein